MQHRRGSVVVLRQHKRRVNLTGIGLLAFIVCAVANAQHTEGDMQAGTSRSPQIHERSTTSATESDAWFKNYRFNDGETLPDLRIHYATLGRPHSNARRQIDNAVLVLHWTGADGSTLLSKNYMEALFVPGRPLDAARYFLIFPHNVALG